LPCGEGTLHWQAARSRSLEAVVAFLRHDPAGTVLCAFNLGEEEIEWALPGGLGCPGPAARP
jgi:glycosidase